jgi:putative heme-binding domain-containing protein
VHGAKAQAFVNIMKGCDKYCTYCIVPFTRGREKSRTIREVLDDLNGLVEKGVREVTLLGQNVNSFGKGSPNTEGYEPRELNNPIGKVGPRAGEENFPQLLYAIDRDPRLARLKRIRFTSSHPLDFSDELIACYAPVEQGGVAKLARHLHLPVQSGSNRVLTKMGRHHRIEHYIAQMKRLKELCPGIGLSTDLIVGFPTETEEEFQETLALLDAIDAGKLPRGDLSAFTVGRLAQSADTKVIAKLNDVWGTIRTTPEDRKGEFEKWRGAFKPAAMKAADLSHGREVFVKTCGACHLLHGQGGKIGPDITGSNRADLEYLLANLLDPSAIVGRDYQTTTVLTKDGRSIAGIVVKESPTSVTLQTPTEQVTVPLDDVETRVLSPQSLMPENQLGQLKPEEAINLVAYLRHPSQVPLPGEGPPPFNGEGRIPGAIEGETLKIVAKSAGDARPQDMSSFKAAHWSGSSHVWWTGARPGGRLVLEVPLEVRGRYEIVAVCSKAHDYGTVTLAWNGAKPTAPIDLYDKDAVTVTPEVSLGVFDLEPGTVPLTVDIVGENPAATKAWMFGLDYVRFVPVKAVEAKP